MNLHPLSFACPHCGSGDVVYSCQPACCFNHVCRHCYTTFEPVTRRVGELEGDVGDLPADPDPSGPTAACARCGEFKLFTISDGPHAGQILCVYCKALLVVELFGVASG